MQRRLLHLMIVVTVGPVHRCLLLHTRSVLKPVVLYLELYKLKRVLYRRKPTFNLTFKAQRFWIKRSRICSQRKHDNFQPVLLGRYFGSCVLFSSWPALSFNVAIVTDMVAAHRRTSRQCRPSHRRLPTHHLTHRRKRCNLSIRHSQALR